MFNTTFENKNKLFVEVGIDKFCLESTCLKAINYELYIY